MAARSLSSPAPSTNLDQRNLALVGFGSLVRGDRDLRGHAFGQGDERASGDRTRLADDDRHAGIASFADWLIDGKAPEKRHVQFRGKFLATAMPEDIGVVVTVRAGVIAHVLD